jgi:hypothetical protein
MTLIWCLLRKWKRWQQAMLPAVSSDKENSYEIKIKQMHPGING